VLEGDDNVLSHATASAVLYRDRRYLVTNMHVVTGKDQDTQERLDGCDVDHRPHHLGSSSRTSTTCHPSKRTSSSTTVTFDGATAAERWG